MSRVGVIRTVLVIAGLTGGCTKVNEQPVARAAPPPPPEPEAKVARPRATSGYSFPTSAAPIPTRAPAAPAPRGSPDAAVAAGTLNGDPKGLRREELSRALDGALPNLATCFETQGGPASVGLSFDADPSGGARNVKVTGGGAGAERCVSSALAAARLPAFEGAAVPVNFPLTIQRSTRTVAAPTPAAPAAPAPPPTFIKP
jgi:hypothetical protein